MTRRLHTEPSDPDLRRQSCAENCARSVVAEVFGTALYAYFQQYSANRNPFTPNNSLWTIPWEIVCYGACAFAGLIGLLWYSRYNVLFAAIWLMVFMQAGSMIIPSG